MDYEKKYNDLVSRLNKAKNDEDVCDDRFCVVIDEILLESNESEDERIRKAVVSFIETEACDSPISKEWLAWLEKQKEPAVNGEGVYYYDGEKFTYFCRPATEENLYDFAMSQQEKQKEQKPAEWSEKDEKMLTEIINSVNGFDAFTGIILQNSEQHEKKINWLKSLRHQPHWKPSDVQMKVPGDAIAYYGDSWLSRKHKILESLYEDLKSL